MVKVTETLVSPQSLLDSLKTDSSGSIVIHLGIVRPDSEGRKVSCIEYEMEGNAAEKELLHIENETMTKFQIQDVALCRKTGRLNLGEVILMAVISAPHRKEAFEACEFAVKQMRNMTSVKKREHFKED
jgi:molybdopterin synthase catalytic subunit